MCPICMARLWLLSQHHHYHHHHINKPPLTSPPPPPPYHLEPTKYHSLSPMETHPSNLLKDHVLQTLLNHLKILILIVVITIQFYLTFKWRLPISHLFLISSFLNLMFFITFKYFFISSSPSIYLVDFSCLKPPNFCRVPLSTFVEHINMIKCFNQDSISFMIKLITSSGLGEQTYLPPPLHYIPPKTSHQDAVAEAQMLLFPVIDNLLSKTKISALDIDILIVSCSGFSPSPSLTSIIINKYSMRDNIKSFNISGMGCSASAISISLAQNLLKINNNCSYAIVVSSEILCNAWYAGNDKSKLPLNSLFRMASAAILLANKRQAKETSKYRLLQVVRSQRAFDDKAYLSAIREEDSKGVTGFTINRDNILQTKSDVLRSNFEILGASVLPFREIIWYVVSTLRKRIVLRELAGDHEAYVPDFKSAIQHFCIPTQGKAVITEIGKCLRLGEREIEASLTTLKRFGNLSSSSMWYVLAHMEAKDRLKRGDKVWQIGLGSGPKCNSLVWECLRTIVDESEKGPWSSDDVH